jgi:hypothetical protein
MKRNQGGFSVVEGLLIFIIVGIIGGTGWYVMNANNKTNDTLDNSGLGTAAKSSKKASPAPASQADPTASWTAYSSVDGKYSLKYPTTWVKATGREACETKDSFLLLGGNSNSVGKYCADGPKAMGQIHVLSEDGDLRKDFGLSKDVFPDLATHSVTVNGVSGERQTGTYKIPADAIGAGPEDGHKNVTYVFYTNGKTYQIAYNLNSGYTDVLSDFDLMVTKTFKFSAQ